MDFSSQAFTLCPFGDQCSTCCSCDDGLFNCTAEWQLTSRVEQCNWTPEKWKDPVEIHTRLQSRILSPARRLFIVFPYLCINSLHSCSLFLCTCLALGEKACASDPFDYDPSSGVKASCRSSGQQQFWTCNRESVSKGQGRFCFTRTDLLVCGDKITIGNLFSISVWFYVRTYFISSRLCFS